MSDTSQLQRKIEELEKENQARATALQKILDASQSKIEVLEREMQAQATAILELQKASEEKEAKVKSLESSVQAVVAESESLKLKMAELRKQQQHLVGPFCPVKLKMPNFTRLKEYNEKWHSYPFYTHLPGYKMCLKVYANGLRDGKGTHVSMFAYLMQGQFDDELEWPFQGHVVVQLCNQLQDKYHQGHTVDFSEATNPKIINRVTDREIAERGWGPQTLIPHSDLNFNPTNNCQYLKNDCLRFEIIAVLPPEHGVHVANYAPWAAQDA